MVYNECWFYIGWAHHGILWKFVFPLHVLNKNKYLQCVGAGTFWKLQKLIPNKENWSVLIAKISSCKTPKITNPQNKLQQKSLATWYSVNYHSNFCWSFIKAVSLFLEWRWPEFIEPHPCVSTHDSGMWRLFTRHTSMLSISRRQTRKGFIPKILMGMKWSYSLWNPI